MQFLRVVRKDSGGDGPPNAQQHDCEQGLKFTVARSERPRPMQSFLEYLSPGAIPPFLILLVAVPLLRLLKTGVVILRTQMWVAAHARAKALNDPQAEKLVRDASRADLLAAPKPRSLK